MIKIRFDFEHLYLTPGKMKIGIINTQIIKLVESGNYSKALEVLDEALNMDPNDALTLLNEGHIFSKIGKIHEAINIYNSLLSKYPKLSSAYYNKATCLALLGKSNEAIDSLGKALEIRPSLIKSIKEDDEFDLLRNLPRYQILIGD